MYGKLIGGAALLLIVGGSVFAFWNHYSSIVESNGNLKESVGKLELAIQEQGVTIDAQKEAISEFKEASAKFKEDLEQIRDEQIEAGQERRRIIDVFSGSDFAKIVNTKPKIAERLVNNGTRRTFRLFECYTGSRGADCVGEGGSTQTTDTSEARASETGSSEVDNR